MQTIIDALEMEIISSLSRRQLISVKRKVLRVVFKSVVKGVSSTKGV
jgi:hypothetical protein